MSQFELFTLETAPEDAKSALQKSADKFGSVLNIFSHMAHSPLPIELYIHCNDALMERGSLSNEEVNIAQLAISVFNECEFCVPAHSAVGRGQFSTDDAVIDAVRDGKLGPDDKINALVTLTQTLAKKRGKLSDADVNAFEQAGYNKEQLFEVLCIVAYKTITNYTSNIAGTQPNEVFAAEAWTPLSKRQQAA